MKIAIVHDYLNQYGGAERVLECFLDLFPNAPVYTMLTDLSKMPARFAQVDIRNSYIHSIPFSKKHYKKMLSLFPTAVEQFDLREYDVILSSSSAFAKGVITNPNQIHICYCYTPMRYVWDLYHQYIQEDVTNPIFRTLLPFVLHKIRMWDLITAQRVDHFIADSKSISRRIAKYYGRESDVIYPPVSYDNFKQAENTEEFFLIVSRMIPYKRIDIAIEAFNKLKKPLVIIGDGYDRKRLESLAGDTITFMGRQPDEVIVEYYSKCKGFILAGEEDFGITPLEAQSSGRPVIAFGKGGALETVVENETGVFFYESTADSIIEAVRKFESIAFDSSVIRKHAHGFNETRFKEEILKYIQMAIHQKEHSNE
ncbi:Glycosyltransferase involved in cell wall bisynthesis [Paenibacillus sp. 1_12]|uniref:glycosyltransferase n=1 Tax=Paenibacillus sp. 1_12 TaxID=1566278 RepID=UPI0008F0D88B|nr:glycosyltransferase [Paenibacillus sp. 1_12]SFM12810.1 Glycosyltransferase involved in cell wall bisynthesis [Paenibacillus sp. 1_12]